MKKFFCLILTLAIFGTTIVFAADEIKVKLNGIQLEFDVQPQVISNRTMVPMRKIFEALGSQVTWDGENQIIVACYQNSIIIMKIDSTVMVVKNLSTNQEKNVALDVPAQIVNGRTMVPVRVISESLGAKVDWEEDTRTVSITTLK